MKTFYTLITTSLLVVLITACTKEGPQGPVGPTGADGNENVLALEITALQTDWVWQDESNEKRFAFIRTIPEIDTDIFEDGAVLVYFRFSNLYTQLPYNSFGSTFVSNTWHITSSSETNNFRVYYKRSTWTSSTNFPGQDAALSDRFYKIVLIDGKSLEQNQDLNLHDIEAVEKRFNLIYKRR